MARTPRRPPVLGRAAAERSGGRRRGPAAGRGGEGEPTILSDLVDVEAPSVGGAAVDTAAYAGAPEMTGEPAIASDLVDVEAPPVGGAAVDTAAYARTGRRPRRSRARPHPTPGGEDVGLVDALAPPPPAPRDDPSRAARTAVDPLGGEGGGAPPRAGPELGGDAPSEAGAPVLESPAPEPPEDLMDRAGRAALRLAADRPWREVTLRDVAREAGLPFAALYAQAPGRRALLLALSARLDREALARLDGEDAPAPRDRLFEAFMARLEVMGRHRDVLLAIGRSEGAGAAPVLPRTARALAEGAGVDTSGPRGALRLAALTAVWARTLQVWRDDEGALNRTMAEIDRQLARADTRLSRVGAGFGGATR